MPKKIEVMANIATIIVAFLPSVVLIKQFLVPTLRGPAVAVQVRRGASVKGSLTGVDWAKNGRTLVLAISTHCHFCSESAPFFQRIAKEAGDDVKLLAVLPQPVAEGKEYLSQEGVRVDEVLQAPLDSVGVQGTPTLLLVDKTGVVTDVWAGKLQPDQQEQVLSVLENKKVGG